MFVTSAFCKTSERRNSVSKHNGDYFRQRLQSHEIQLQIEFRGCSD